MSEFTELLDDNIEINDDVSFDAIMAEYKYESVTTRKRPQKETPESSDDDTLRIRQITEDMKKLARDAQNLREEHPSPKSDEPVGEVFFGLPETFEKAFSPSSAYVREESDAQEEEPAPEPKKDRLGALKKRLRHKPPESDDPPERAAARLGPYTASLRVRALIALILLFPLGYLSLAQPYGWPLPGALLFFPHPYRHTLLVAVLMLLVMACAVDMLAKGFSDMIHLRPGTETLVCVNCIASLAQVLSITAFDGFAGYLPYCAVTGGIVTFALFGQVLLYSARVRSYKAASAAQSPDVVLLEENLWDGLNGYTRRPGSAHGFVARTEAPDVVQRTMSFLSPLLILAPLLLALASSLGLGRPEDFFWAWAALSAAVVPFGSLFAFSLPFAKVAKRLAHMGVAIPGWTAARAFSSGTFAVVSDGDLFPAGTVTLNGLKVFGQYSYERITSLAASLLAASGSGLFAVMQDLTRETRESLRRVTSFEHYEGGGVGGEIDHDRVLLGSSAFMLRMGIRLPQQLNIKNAILVSVNLNIAGIFAVNYISADGVENALHLFERQKITPVLAVRDFNISPLMLKNRFGINADALEYPPIEDRLALSDPGRETPAKPMAVLAREGLSPYAESIVGGMRLHKITLINLFIQLLSAIGGLLLMFYFTYVGTAEAALSITPGNVLIFMFLWWLPIWLVSIAANRY